MRRGVGAFYRVLEVDSDSALTTSGLLTVRTLSERRG
jgi:hypothetical protein